MGWNMYQQPTPKQDKGGGIIPTAEGARIVITSSVAACRHATCCSVHYSLTNTRKTRGWEQNPKRGMGRNLARPIAIAS